MSSIVIVSAKKPNRNSKVGISLRDADDGGVFVSAIKHDSIFAPTLLQVGMKVDEINEIKCHDLTNGAAADIIRNSNERNVTIKAHITHAVQQMPAIVSATLVDEGQLAQPVIVDAPPPAQSPEYNSSVVYVIITKPTKDTKTGITFTNSEDGGVFVKEIKPSSLFLSTNLKEGMIVDEINGVPCEGMTNRQVADLVRDAEGEVYIKAHHRDIPL